MGEIIRFFHGSVAPVECLLGESKRNCAFKRDCVFMPMWKKAEKAISEVYDSTTFQDLVEEEMKINSGKILNYVI